MGKIVDKTETKIVTLDGVEIIKQLGFFLSRNQEVMTNILEYKDWKNQKLHNKNIFLI